MKIYLHSAVRSLLTVSIATALASFSANALAQVTCSTLTTNTPLPATITSASIILTPLVNNDCVNVSAASTYGIEAANAGNSIAATDTPSQLYVVTTGGSGYGVFAYNGGSIVLQSADVYTTGPTAFGVFAQANSIISATGVIKVDTTGSPAPNARGIDSEGTGAAINLNNVNVLTNGNGSYGMTANTNGSIHISGTTAIDTSAGTSSNTYGVYANGSLTGTASVTLDKDVNITTGGNTSYGMYANSTLLSNASTITTNGPVNIDTHTHPGTSTYGVYSNGAGAVVNMAGDGSAASVATNVIGTGGNYSYGLYALNGGVIDITGASSTTPGVYTTSVDTSSSPGDYTVGVLADGLGAQVNVGNSISIATGGLSSEGVKVMNGGVVNFTDIADIDTSLDTASNAIGALALGVGSKITFATDVTLKTDGDGSYGLYAHTGGTIIADPNSKTTISSTNPSTNAEIGIIASGANSTVTLANVDSTTRGDKSSGMRADTGGVITTNGTLSIDTSGPGNNTYGIHSDVTPSAVNITGDATTATSIITGGNSSYGLYANAGGAISIDSLAAGMTIDSTSSGDNTTGVYSTNKPDLISPAVKSTITLTGGPVTIKTAGIASYGMFAEGGSKITNDDATIIDSNTAASSPSKIGVYASGDDGTTSSLVSLKAIDVTTSGASSSALRADLGAQITIVGVTRLDTEGSGVDAYGAHADGVGNGHASMISITGGAATTSIITNGDYSFGLYANAGGVISVDSPAGMTIDSTSSGDNTTGVHATNAAEYHITPNSTTTPAKSTITLTGGAVTISTAGKDSYGMHAEGGSTITNTYPTTIDSTVYSGGVSKTGKIGIYASGEDGATPLALSTISLTNDLTITSAGDGSSGIRAEAGGQVTVTGSIIIDSTDSGNNTLGMHATGYSATDNTKLSTITVGSSSTNTAITTSGSGSHGVEVDNGGRLVANGPATISTNGIGADGVLVDSRLKESWLAANGGSYDITTLGATSHGVAIIADQAAVPNGLKNTTILVKGSGSDAVNITGDQVDVTMKIINSNLTSLLNNGITVNGSTGHTRDITVDPSTITACNGYALYASNNSKINFKLTTSSTLNGAVATDNATSLIDMAIDSTSTWNAASTTTTLGCTTASTKSSSVHSLTNSGTTSLAGLGAGKNLTVAGNYTATAANLVVDAKLAGDYSPVTKLIVNGVATGDTTITVNNIGGLGAPTNVGIPVVMVTNPASTGTFSLVTSPITVGTFNYTLKQGGYGGNPNSWYLVNGLPPAPTASPIPALSNLMLLVIALSLVFVSLLKLNVLNFRKK